MTKTEQAFFDQWKINGIKELARQRKIPKATKAQQAAWDQLMKGAK